MTERWPANADHITQTVARMRAGAIVSFPTDTLYAVASRALDSGAVSRLYRVKRRSEGQPMIWLVSEAAVVEPYAVISATAIDLMARFWPGPLTLVLPAKPSLDHPTLAVRAPNHPVALRLLAELGEPVASSSANRGGEAPPIDADAVIAGLADDVDIVLDGGACQIGQASTILDLTADAPRILRRGAIAASALLP
jgi:L-threonylcarbamoyladenylate synthase